MAVRIIYDSWGQMCNRLWEYLDQVAWAKQNKSKVLSLFWDSSLVYFNNLRDAPYIQFPFYINCIQNTRLGHFYYLFLIKLLHNKYVQSVFASTFFKRIGFVSGTKILYSHDNYPTMWKDIRILFSPNKDIIERIDCFFYGLRQSSNSVIIGVHIRRGDYRTFCGARFFYSDEEIDDFMLQLCNLFGNDTLFFISSNEAISDLFYKKYHIIDSNNSNPVEDMYCLSKCDFILGPYSSFSSWASFYNNVPYCRMRRGLKIKKEDFSPVEYFIPTPME